MHESKKIKNSIPIIIFSLIIITLIFQNIQEIAHNQITGLHSLTLTSVNINNCTNLDSQGETYILTQDINTTGPVCLNITKDDITINCAGHSINGSSSTTLISAQKVNNITIENCILQISFRGILLNNSNYTSANNVNISEATWAVYALEANNLTLNSVRINESGNGIWVDAPNSYFAENFTFNHIVMENLSDSTNATFGIAFSHPNSGTASFKNIRITDFNATDILGNALFAKNASKSVFSGLNLIRCGTVGEYPDPPVTKKCWVPTIQIVKSANITLENFLIKENNVVSRTINAKREPSASSLSVDLANSTIKNGEIKDTKTSKFLSFTCDRYAFAFEDNQRKNTINNIIQNVTITNTTEGCLEIPMTSGPTEPILELSIYNLTCSNISRTSKNVEAISIYYGHYTIDSLKINDNNVTTGLYLGYVSQTTITNADIKGNNLGQGIGIYYEYPVLTSHPQNITIKNTNITGGQKGIALLILNCDNTTVKNLNLNNFTYGVYLNLTADKNTITDLNLTGFNISLVIENSHNNTIKNVNSVKNQYGFSIYGNYNNITSCTFKNNQYYGLVLSSFLFNPFSGNCKANGQACSQNSECCSGNCENNVCSQAMSCSHSIVQHSTFENNSIGIYLNEEDNEKIYNNTFLDNNVSIFLETTISCNISQNKFNNSRTAILINGGETKTLSEKQSWTQNPSASWDMSFAIAKDSKDDYAIAGFDGINPWDWEWRVIKINNTNNETIWNWTQDSSDDDLALAVTSDNQDNFIAAGYDNTQGHYQWRIVKINGTTGTTIWNWTQNPSNDNVINGITFDNNSNTYIACGYDNKPGNYEWRVVKINNTNNETIWNWTQNPTANDDEARAITVDIDGNYLVAGNDNSSDERFRVVKINSTTGTTIWNWTQNPSTGSDRAYAIAVDAEGNYVVAGIQGSGGVDALWRVVKINRTTRAVIWNWTLNPTTSDEGAYGIAIDSNNNYIIVGNDASGEWKVVRLKPTGNSYLSWSKNYGDCSAQGVVIDSNDNFIVAGYDFSPGDPQMRVETIYANTLTNSQIHNNTFNNNSIALNISGTENNYVYYNKFYNSKILHATTDTTNNHFNTTSGGTAQGNYWDDVYTKSLDIKDTNGDSWGDAGTQYPYSSSNGGNVTGYVTDWGPAAPTGTIFGCGVNLTSNHTMTSNLNCNGTAINIIAEGVELDCANYYIAGNTSGKGIKINASNVTITNCKIYNFAQNIVADPGTGLKVNNTHFNNSANCTVLNAYNNSLIFDNNYFNCTQNAIVLINDSNNNSIYNNNINYSGIGINILSGENNTVWNNTFTNSITTHANSVANNNFNNTNYGNHWDDIQNLQIYDTNGDGIGDAGNQYPYSVPNGANVAGDVRDFKPYTTKTQPTQTTRRTGGGGGSNTALLSKIQQPKQEQKEQKQKKQEQKQEIEQEHPEQTKQKTTKQGLQQQKPKIKQDKKTKILQKTEKRTTTKTKVTMITIITIMTLIMILILTIVLEKHKTKPKKQERELEQLKTQIKKLKRQVEKATQE